jgi:hypothetical protein
LAASTGIISRLHRDGLATAATISGGENNSITGGGLGTYNTTIGGGYGNVISGSAYYATIPGGSLNVAAAPYAFAAGVRANALHTSSFVWSDISTLSPFSSTADHQFCIRARGGVQLEPLTGMFFGAQTRQMLNLWGTAYGIGVQGSTLYFRSDSNAGPNGGFIWYKGGVHNDSYLNAGGGTELMHLVSGGLYVNGALVPSSDRNAKENFQPVNSREVLEKVVGMPLSRWNYKADKVSEHIGPMAQDFYAAFGVGSDDKHIATVDADGVALELRSAKGEGRIQQLEAENSELKARLEKLEQLVGKLTRE